MKGAPRTRYCIYNREAIMLVTVTGVPRREGAKTTTSVPPPGASPLHPENTNKAVVQRVRDSSTVRKCIFPFCLEVRLINFRYIFWANQAGSATQAARRPHRSFTLCFPAFPLRSTVNSNEKYDDKIRPPDQRQSGGAVPADGVW